MTVNTHAQAYQLAPFTDRELRRYRIETPANDHWPFPKDYSERKAYLFQHTGYIAKRMDWRGWYCLNTAINRGLHIGLPENSSDRTLLMLSLIDHSLGEVPRWVKARKVHTQRADSTAAHSKQSMNLIDAVFEDSGVAARLKKGILNSPTAKLRHDALVGAWLHDMGEVIMEVTTATDSFGMTPDEKTTLTNRRHALEDDIFLFACDLAAHMIARGTPEKFNTIIWKLREAATNAHASDSMPEALRCQLNGATLPAQQTILRLNALEQGLAHYNQQFGFNGQHCPEAQELLRIGNRVEGKTPNDFLRPLLKALESIEGQRYLQRNAGEFATDRLSRLQHGAEFSNQTILCNLIDDYDVVQSTARCEKHIADMLATAKTTDEKALAKSAARFVYRSLARQFAPPPGEQVGTVCDIIDRLPTPPKHTHNLSITELTNIRSADQAYKAEQMAKQTHAGNDNNRYITRQQAADIYYAAADLVGNAAFKPPACLLDLKTTPTLPQALTLKIQQRRQLAASGQAVPVPEFPAEANACAHAV